MDLLPADADADGPESNEAGPGNTADRVAEAGPPQSSVPDAGAYKKRHHGREAMDRWMLHETFMEDEVEGMPPSREEGV